MLDARVTVTDRDGEQRDGEQLIETVRAREDGRGGHAAREALRALGFLPDRQRRYLTLKVAGYSYQEIGELTGRSYTSVNKRLARAREQLSPASGSTTVRDGRG